LERTDHGHLGQVVTYLAIEGADSCHRRRRRRGLDLT
jgi:hypothetical protein